MTPTTVFLAYAKEQIKFRFALLLCAAVILPTLPANAHSWYSTSCCSNQDCHPVDASETRRTPAGWLVTPTGEVIPYGDSREQVSEGGGYHRCSRHFIDPAANDTTICLFVPGIASQERSGTARW